MERETLIRLVTEAQKGDSVAMNDLFASFYNDVYYFALKTVTDSDTACDITQETFLEIIHTIGNLKEPAAFVTWMKQITYHQCTRYFRKKKDVPVEEDEDGSTIFDTLADESENSIPSEIYEKEEFRSTIHSMIGALTEEQRSAVMMYYFDELPVAQIAQIQGVSEGTVKSRLNYARKAIKKSVESYEEKHNIKLHSFSCLPLFALFFGEEFMPAAQAAQIQATVSAAASAAGSAAAAAAVSAGSSAAAGTGLMAKIAALPTVTKIIAGVIAAAVAAGGGAMLAANHFHRDDEHLWADCVDGNRDCICDVCSSGIHFFRGERYYGVMEHEAFCDNCGISLGFHDDDANFICDVCGQFPCGDFHHDGHEDGDSDGMCEWCGVNFAAENIPTEPIELKDFNLEIADGILHIFYPDGEMDPHVDYYEIHIGELGITEKISGTEFDLNPYGIDSPSEIVIEVLGVNEKNAAAVGNWVFYQVLKIPAVPTVSISTNRENAILTITPVDGAEGYEIYINGVRVSVTNETTFIANSSLIKVGLNELSVRAYNKAGHSDLSNPVTTGKLEPPTYHATGTGIEFLWGDVANADGYIIYGDDGAYLTTIGLSEPYDFAPIYTADGFYFPYIQAYADGWISSEKAGIPVSIGSNGGPIGN